MLALIEGIGLYLSYQAQGIFVDSGILSGVLVVTGLMAGTALLMWIGDQITNKGIGNGVSMIIFIGIVSRLPSAVSSIWSLIMTESGFSTTGLLVSISYCNRSFNISYSSCIYTTSRKKNTCTIC